ncbi:hypothetical protein LEM8419_00147 [Neolewinella maritima]|uniref:Uncharacterized protein n=1 Tax=Neolewinella maritima TaxID=1383882 RepID=A0ABM9AWQ0_9BACT|nr:hypothetical protein [Neolewinella maritima]CAH0998832.1 hypothetical protein LEM8419_00147 [Neolewinella maritima]
MPYYNNDEYATAQLDYETDPYDAYEGYAEAYDEFDGGGLEAAKPKRSSKRLIRSVKRLQQQMNHLHKHLSRISRSAGTPANLARRLKELEGTTSRMQQSQLMAQLFDLPQLGSIQYEGDDEAQRVEHSSFDKQSVLLLQLLGQGGGMLGGGGNGKSDSMQALLPFLLLSQDNKKGEDDTLSTLLLFSLINNC